MFSGGVYLNLPPSCIEDVSWAQFSAFCLASTLTRRVVAGGGGGVIAVCRWRACGSCWLWRLLYARGWTKRRSGVRFWPCCPPSRSHKLSWLELDTGLRAPDPDLLRRLVLKDIHSRLKTNPSPFQTSADLTGAPLSKRYVIALVNLTKRTAAVKAVNISFF